MSYAKLSALSLILFCFAGPLASQCCDPAPPGLLAWWPLDEPTGPVAAELVSGRDGLHDAAPLPVPGQVGGALSFGAGGVLNAVVVAPDPAFNFGLTQDFSIDAWIRADPDPIPTYRPIVTKLNEGPTDFPYGWQLYLYDGYLSFGIQGETLVLPFTATHGACDAVTPGCTQLNDSTWHFVAVTVDRDRSPDGGTLYVDGAPVVSFDPTTLMHSPDNINPLLIGQHVACLCVPTSPTFLGDIDEVEVFDRELAASEIQSLHAAGSLGKCKIPCTITTPTAGSVVAGSPVPIIFDVDHPQMAAVDLAFDWSTDAGLTWSAAASAAASPLPNPAGAVPTPLVGGTFLWDAAADGVGVAVAQATTIRVTAGDAIHISCTSVDLTVVGLSSCTGLCGDCDQDGRGPNILDALVAAQISSGLVLPTPLQAACCDANASGLVEILDALLIAQSGAGLMVVLTCP